MESLRGAGLLSSSPPKSASAATSMAILRIGIGIGRPTSREHNAVADYVLSKMGAQEMQALREAVPEVVEVLVQEMYRIDEDEV
jgi:PTH1 family peptidyl-tRNA hydrolase